MNIQEYDLLPTIVQLIVKRALPFIIGHHQCRKNHAHTALSIYDIHTSLLIYPYGPGKIFIRPCHTDQLDYLIKVLRTGCFCIGPGIDSRSAVLALGLTALGANTANLEYIPGPIQKQPVSNIQHEINTRDKIRSLLLSNNYQIFVYGVVKTVKMYWTCLFVF